MESEVVSFGRWLRHRRLALHLTQQQLGSLAACSLGMVRKMEADERRPSQDAARLLAIALRIPEHEREAFVRFARGERERRPMPPRNDANSLAIPPLRLPVPPNALIGREHEVQAVRRLIGQRDVRLVTITGIGGVGKTRVALAVAAGLGDAFVDGVVFVDLAPLLDPALVLPSIAQALDVREGVGRPRSATLRTYLRDKQILLLLDNFEQVLPAAPVVAELLQAAPHVRVLVTSRTRLQLQHERELVVLPLAVPPVAEPVNPATLQHFDAVMLFIARAQAVRSDFVVGAANAQAVAEICARLDGLPLSIELAAARIKLLSPEALLQRLDDRLSILTRGARDAPARHQTLRAAIDWSYNLLDRAGQVLFARMAVFAKGCTLDAIQVVCNATGDLGDDVLDSLQLLVDSSLVQPAPGFEDETLREYALEQLAARGEANDIRRRHAMYFLGLADDETPRLQPAQSGPHPRRLEVEQHNLRAALRWCRAQPSAAGEALRLAASVWSFWERYGFMGQGRAWLAGAVAMLHVPPDTQRSRHPEALTAGQVSVTRQAARNKRVTAFVLFGLADLVWRQGEHTDAEGGYERILALFRGSQDTWGIRDVLSSLELQLDRQEQDGLPEALHEASLALFRELGDNQAAAAVLKSWGDIVWAQGDSHRALTLLEPSLALFRELGDQSGITRVLNSLGEAARLAGDYGRAHTYYRESLSTSVVLGNASFAAWVRHNLAHTTCRLGDYSEADALFRDSLAFFRAHGHVQGIMACLAGLAGVAAARADYEEAARLCGAADKLVSADGLVLNVVDNIEYPRNVAAIRASLGDEAFARLHAEGELGHWTGDTLTLDDP